MKIKIFIALFVTALTVSSCVAQSSGERKVIMIFLSYEGTPRAHIPAAAWFAGKTIPTFASDEGHDGFWKLRFAAAPKFTLTADAFDKVESLLRVSSEAKSAFVVEFLHESKRPEIRYLDLKSFEHVRNVLREATVKGHEVLADWPTRAK